MTFTTPSAIMRWHSDKKKKQRNRAALKEKKQVLIAGSSTPVTKKVKDVKLVKKAPKAEQLVNTQIILTPKDTDISQAGPSRAVTLSKQTSSCAPAVFCFF